ncbi:MAG TPA: tRNA 2-thiocytidine biosynthesis protein TtcA [Firmicutes bacterium]|uniref:tRNA 2-thiocytidine biosynthesis protein TtcA n=1 Tax=Capillibacterium thermochitinicola TaxID=2699427 RepID=A0A8J6HYT6_9FIRM|nr:tRNA 2-thiocytidine biosynthesis TtcA family protein [Capillibacterium thermochitinicola]MBA2132341.1 tRNA 2-thiocytidine biosynthesis protein TtcA [Capillibacterium thermochitinicola]HHW12598.1 tRNA 2-thiocytidine biosynthesis protein TtcA [Bacillota bacterium]
MKPYLPKGYNQKILRAIREFDLIEPGDRILIGFSGGKDSALLVWALGLMAQHRIIEAEVAALTLDLGLEPHLNPEPLAELCAKVGVEFHYLPTGIGPAVLATENPCATCSFLRNGRLNRFAGKHKFNKVALAHHHDDAVETLLMSMLYSGQIRTFLPKTYLDRTRITVIRPLVYLREEEIRAAREFIPYQPVARSCPYDGYTYRQKVKDLIAALNKENPLVYANLSKAMRGGRPITLWPAPKKR